MMSKNEFKEKGQILTEWLLVVLVLCSILIFLTKSSLREMLIRSLMVAEEKVLENYVTYLSCELASTEGWECVE